MKKLWRNFNRKKYSKGFSWKNVIFNFRKKKSHERFLTKILSNEYFRNYFRENSR